MLWVAASKWVFTHFQDFWSQRFFCCIEYFLVFAHFVGIFCEKVCWFATQIMFNCEIFCDTGFFFSTANFFFLRDKSLFLLGTNQFARKTNCPLQGIAGGTFLYITFFEVLILFFHFHKDKESLFPLWFQPATISITILHRYFRLSSPPQTIKTKKEKNK